MVIFAGLKPSNGAIGIMGADKTHTEGWSYPIACYVIGIALLVYLVLAAFAVVYLHLDLCKYLVGEKLIRAHFMCGAFGMLGASVASIRKYYKVIITESISKAKGTPFQPLDWGWGWVFYYLTRPLLGSVLGALSFTLSFVGFQVLETSGSVDISAEGRFLLYAVSFVSGFAVSHVLDRLEAMSEQMFQATDN